MLFSTSLSSMFALVFTIFALNLDACLAQTSGNSTAPIATVKNGTFAGRYLPVWDQDLFLGIPYAQPPLGQLRFKTPQILNTSFAETKDASQYGHSCYQYATNFNLSEDCLTLNGKLVLSRDAVNFHF